MEPNNLTSAEEPTEAVGTLGPETLPDRARFSLNAKQWQAFQAALEAPAPPATRLMRLLNEPSVFEDAD